ncbi:MAG: hypothetical protein NTV57_06565 [Cyanobacteria bacterium]|nr:hypothetical protein [Cyanobacteriota bacterium]
MITVVSGSDKVRLESDINHINYCRRHGYSYFCDRSVHDSEKPSYFRKIKTLLSMDTSDSWLFWIDDDAYFTRPSQGLESFTEGVGDDIFLIVCASPVNPQGKWTYLSSGQFFIRNTSSARCFLKDVYNSDLKKIGDWWNGERLGMFTNGDQDAIVYNLFSSKLMSSIARLDYTCFNCRPYHYQDRLDEHFLVHFPGVPDKRQAVDIFAKRVKGDLTLLSQ